MTLAFVDANVLVTALPRSMSMTVEKCVIPEG